MKNVIFTFAMSLVLACSAQKNTLQIPANKTVQLDYPIMPFGWLRSTIKAWPSIRVVVVNKANNDTIRGFGLANKGKADVMVERNAYLCLINSNGKPVEISVGVSEQDPVSWKNLQKMRTAVSPCATTQQNQYPYKFPGL
jgi:hypothetical protein